MSDAPQDPQETSGPVSNESTFDSDTVGLCESVVEDFRRGETRKAEAAAQLYRALRFEEVVEESDLQERERAYETYFDMLEAIDKERNVVDDGGVPGREGDPPQETTSESEERDGITARVKPSLLERLTEPSPRKRLREDVDDGSDSESDRRARTKRLVDESLFPFISSIPEDVRQLPDALQRTLVLKENYTRDLTLAKQRVICSPGCPPVPDSVWTDILANRYVDLDRVFSAIYTIDGDHKQSVKLGELELSGLPTKPKKHIERHGHWTIAWALYQRAVLYVYPHREQELRTYYDQINGFFAAVSELEAFRIINLDRAIRGEVGRSNTLLLSDFSRFNHLYTMHVVGAGAATPSFSQGSSTSRRAATRRPGACSSRSCRYRHICSSCSGRDHVASSCPQKAPSGTFNDRRK
ncbi:hypothetical protein FKP32DRAFT_1714216 [Trametes sanguinea]|nr:hypothetical protein FKP32DRAFT_1714216 [Trametes sanguinea]